MRLPLAFDSLRTTRFWRTLRDWRYLRDHRTRCEFYRQFVRAGSLVFDIGANVGHYALIFDHLRARVVTVEPQAELATGLQLRFAGRKRVQVLQSAVGSARSNAVLHKAPGQTEIASLRGDIAERSRFGTERSFTETETVCVTTLDLLIATYGTPDFCKIDVEGFEVAVMNGLTRALPLLSLEFNREFWPETVQCVERLVQLGSYQFNYTLGESTALASTTWLDAATLIAVLGKNSDPLLWGDIYARHV